MHTELNMGKRLQDKVAIVLGAGSDGTGLGNGKATALLFAREGASIIAADVNLDAARETESMVRAEGGACEAVQADVTQTDHLRRTVELCMQRHGRVDILQCNVGYSRLGGPVDMEADVWQEQMEVNVGYVFAACKLVLPIMEAQRQGAIVTVSSIASLRYLGVDFIGYSAFKAALNHFTRSVAMQYAAKGVRANVVVPGRMDTPTVRNQLNALYGSEDELVARRDASCPSGKQGDAWDIAHASLFLASDEAKYVNGVVLPVDGGVTCCTSGP